VRTDGNPVSDARSRLDLETGLAALGYEAFRPGQKEAIATLLRVGRLLLVAPTGGGKSLIYQLPATLLPGTTLVVSPLVSLMHDQAAALGARGIPATYLAATLDGDELRARMRDVARGAYKLVYVAPERLAFDGFRGLVRDLGCPLVAIDEAHCISEWGHDFRPEYMQIGELLGELSGARVLACTATATPVVRDEIVERLGLAADTPQLVHGFARPNLALQVLEVRSARGREQYVDRALTDALGAPGAKRGTAIVYAPTRKSVEQETARLRTAGWEAVGYHAGMGGADRDAAQRQFQAGAAEVVVATNAFGMGIDRPDVRTIVHLAPPGSIAAYYQEVGRAGRDGADASGMLLVSPGDLPLRRRLIEADVDGRAASPEIVAHRWGQFLELMRWAEGGSCRHDAILRYFGDEAETLSGCGRCDVCRRLGEAAEGGETTEDDPAVVDVIVRKALSAVARVHGRFGLLAAAKLLRGVDDPRLAGAGLTATRTFGALAERSEEWLTHLLRRCVTAGWVDFHGGDRPVVVLTEEGSQVMRGERPARLLLPAARSAADRIATGGRVRRVASAPADPSIDLDAEGVRIFEALRRHRLELARAEDVPPYVVASDRALRDIASLRPRSLAELTLAHGIGPAKAEKYGIGFLQVVASCAGSAP